MIEEQDSPVLNFQEVIDAIPAAVFVKDSQSRLVLMNRACEQQWGITFAEIGGTDGSACFPPEQMELFLATDREVFAGGVPVTVVEPVRNASLGEDRVGHTIKQPIYDREGRPSLLIGVTIDITAASIAQDQLRASEEKLRGLYELAPLGIALTDMAGKYLDFNPEFRRITGYTQDELNRLDYWALTPPEYAPREQEQLASLQNTGRYGPYEKDYVNKDGQRVPLRLNGVLVHGPGGEPNIWSIVEDVTSERNTKAEIESQRARLDEIIRSTDAGTWEWNRKTGELRVNERWAAIMGYRLDELGPVSIETRGRLCHPDDLPVADAALVRACNRETEFYDAQMRMRHKDGRWVWVLSRGKVVEWADDGSALRMSGTLVDVTERVERSEELRRQKEALELAGTVFHSAREGIVITDAGGVVVAANDAVTHIMGYTREEVIGANPVFGSDLQGPEIQAMRDALAAEGHWEGEFWNRRKDGTPIAQLLKVSTIRDEDGRPKNLVALFSDVTRQKEHQRELERSAYFDALTGLPNRVLLRDRLRQAILAAKRERAMSACLYLDLDGFKQVNDTLGHGAGDMLLVQIANRMRSAMRESDTLARIGGDEFVGVIVDLESMVAVEALLERLLRAACQPIRIDGTEVQVSASIGVTLFPQAIELDADLLLRQADQAMYQSKLRGKNCFTLFDEVNDRNIRESHETLTRIRTGLGAGEFRLFYQPKVDLRAGQVVGAEALIRWQHPERGLLLPAAFLPVLQNHPLAGDVGDWVIETALTQIETWRRAGLRLPVSVNVDLRQLSRPDFPAKLGAALARHPGVGPGDLHLEILETSGIDDEKGVISIIDECRAFGVAFSLDDFGTGYSSLSYLRRLKVDQVKIDQSFIRDMLENPGDMAIVEGIIALAGVFGLKVIAEGVETLEHQRLLMQVGCPWMQGFAMARPLPAGEFETWVRNWKPDPEIMATTPLPAAAVPLVHARSEFQALLKAARDGETKIEPGEGVARFGLWLEGPARAVLQDEAAFESLLRDYREALAAVGLVPGTKADPIGLEHAVRRVERGIASALDAIGAVDGCRNS